MMIIVESNPVQRVNLFINNARGTVTSDRTACMITSKWITAIPALNHPKSCILM